MVVAVLPDDTRKHLSTDLLREEPVKPAHLAPHIEPEGCDAFKRVCYTCCDPVACGERVIGVDRGPAAATPSCPWRTRP